LKIKQGLEGLVLNRQETGGIIIMAVPEYKPENQALLGAWRWYRFLANMATRIKNIKGEL